MSGTVPPADPDDNQLLPAVKAEAVSLVKKAKRVRKGVPTEAELAEAINDVQLSGSIKQVSNIVITFADADLRLLRSGLLDVDENSKIDAVDLNFPSGSRYWWRLTIVSPSLSNGTINLTFLTRECVIASQVFGDGKGYSGGATGPFKANRAQMTRAEFLKAGIDIVNKVTGSSIEFYCSQLDVKQKITKPDTKSSSKQTEPNSSPKAPGLGADFTTLTSKGVKLTGDQAAVANRLLAVAAKYSKSQVATEALILDAIYESNLGQPPLSNGSYGGVLGGSVKIFSPDLSSLEAEAKAALLGGQGYRSLNDLATTKTDPLLGGSNQQSDIMYVGSQCTGATVNGQYTSKGYSPQYLNENSSSWTMEDAVAEAKAIVSSGGATAPTGGASGSVTTSTLEAYNYRIGAKEAIWNGEKRLAQQVNWELFWDGDRLYFDDEQTLITQKVAAVIDLDDDVVLDFSGDWDARQICTQCTLVLADHPWQFRPGECFQLQNWGPFSSGSSATPHKRPGVWLIQDLSRGGSDEGTTYTLVQPDLPKMEPAPQVKTTTSSVDSSGNISAGAGTPDAVWEAAMYLDSLHLIYSQQVRILVRDASKFKGKYYLDCSASTGWCLLAAGFKLPDGITWGDNGPTTASNWASVLEPGRGQQMTIWIDNVTGSTDHMFFELNIPHLGHKQGNTVNPGGAGFGFFDWDKAGTGGWGGPSPAGVFTPMHYKGT